MSKNKQDNNPVVSRRSTALQQALLTIGPILVVIGTVSYGISVLTLWAGWMVSIGGGIGAFGVLLSAFVDKTKSARVRRLDRMIFLGLLMFIVSGGFMIQGSSSWLAIFAVGTVFYVYAVFAKDRALKREEK
ncbi:MAG: hypothetical protein PUK66_03215 [Bacteroidales bacterium]|uniref:hypothetical protein n=1 Tax=Porphyromonas sp. TaxID=1924944 RepID=UPI002975D73E|nr:hypothetical protein [Porphyromonas sp.]MDD7437831.1 hypothetical protein [Bacteroidales bacterium]MDY3066424.1 hypothetical protein [Porphyromonas sp.]